MDEAASIAGPGRVMVRIRRATVEDASAMARVHAESWRSTYRGIVPDHFLDSIDVQEWTERRRRSLTNPSDGVVSHVAEVGREVIGWAVGDPNRDMDSPYAGELYAIYLLLDYQRRGIGHRLTMATAEGLLDSGIGSMLAWALADNWPARRFYEALGAEYVQERQIAIGGASLREAAYGWDDLGRLVAMREGRRLKRGGAEVKLGNC